MIYLVCAQNSDKELVDICRPKTIDTAFWGFVKELTNHRNVVYSFDFYQKASKQILPNRVNIIFSLGNKKGIPPIMNAIIETKVNQISQTYGNKVDDVYIIADNHLVDLFYKTADYLIVYSTDELSSTDQSIFDAINFAHYNILTKENIENHTIELYVKVKTALGL